LADFEAIIAARAFDSSAEQFADLAALEGYVDSTGGAVMRLAAKILGGDSGQKIEETAREAALAYGLTGLLRSLGFHNARHKLYMPLDLLGAVGLTPDIFFELKHDARVDAVAHQLALRARDHFLKARKAPRPRAALPALLPAALVPVYLRRLGREVPIHRRQMALLGASMKQRL
jgi:phytoene synthase